MSYKPEEKDWMAYLYGELGEEEKRQFEAYILEYPEARLELEKFQKLRTILSRAEDKEVIAPPIFVGEGPHEGNGAGHSVFWNTPYLRTITTVAASLLIIMLVGRFSGTELSVSNHEFRLTFGDRAINQHPAEVLPVSSLSPEQVQQMINTSLDRNNTLVKASLEETQKKLDASIRSNLTLNSGKLDHLVREASTASQQQIRQFVDGIRTENMQQVKDYFQLTSTEQKKYIENLLVDFAKYLQQQRNNDLQLVQTRMNSLEQNTDLFKQETEQILSSIITSVGNPVSGETRN